MTQAIIDNAAAISFNRDLTVATSVSQSRKLKYFRRGPIQSTAEVEMNVVTRDVYSGILGAYSKDILGPYSVKFPAEVVGDSEGFNITVSSANQTGTSIGISSSANETVLNTGDIIQFPGTSGTYIVVSDVTTGADGTASITIDNPVLSSPTNAGKVTRGAGITFSMYITERPRASFGPTGLVNHDGAFIFTEEL